MNVMENIKECVKKINIKEIKEKRIKKDVFKKRGNVSNINVKVSEYYGSDNIEENIIH